MDRPARHAWTTPLNLEQMTSADTSSPRIVKRSVVVAGHRTSVSLEGPFWDELKRIAETKRVSLNQLVAEVDGHPEVGIVGSKLLYGDGSVQHAGVVFMRSALSPYHIYRKAPADLPAVTRLPAASVALAEIPTASWANLLCSCASAAAK